MEVFDAELWAIGLALEVTIERRETLQRHAVKTVTVFRNSQAAIRRTAHLEPGPGTWNRAARKQRVKSTTTIAIDKRTAAIDSRRRIDPGASFPAPARPQEEGAHENPRS